MEEYFSLVSNELLGKLDQIKEFIKKHNPTIGVLTEEILRDFLRNYLPKQVSVEQGFILSPDGKMSKQCDVLIYDSNRYAPFYRLNDIVVVPADSVLAIVEVKTTINKSIFDQVVLYFKDVGQISNAKKYLFMYNSRDINTMARYVNSCKVDKEYVQFDHNNFGWLPDEIVGINKPYHLHKDYVIGDRDSKGFSSYLYENVKGKAVGPLQSFYMSVYSLVEDYINNEEVVQNRRANYYSGKNFKSYFAFGVFDM